MTKTELANENAVLRAELSQALNDVANEKVHVKKLQIIIANRYSAKPSVKLVTDADVQAKIDESLARRAALRAKIAA